MRPPREIVGQNRREKQKNKTNNKQTNTKKQNAPTMIITHAKLKDRFDQYGVPDMWLAIYKIAKPKSALTMIGTFYHSLMARLDMRQMSEGQKQFVRMVIQFPPEWKDAINVTDSWDDVSQFLQVNREQPTEKTEVKASWPVVKRRLIQLHQHCTSCDQPTRIGCVIDAAQTIRLCKKCSYQRGLGVYFRPRYSTKNEGSSSFTLDCDKVKKLLEQASGHKVGETENREIHVTIEQLTQAKPLKFTYTHDVEVKFYPKIYDKSLRKAVFTGKINVFRVDCRRKEDSL